MNLLYRLTKAIKRGNKVTLQLTTHCNLTCSYCNLIWVNGKYPFSSTTLSFKEWKSIIDKWTDVKEVALSGGEPTIYKDFDILLDYLLKRFHVLIFTNGVKKLKSYPFKYNLRYIISKHTEMNWRQARIWRENITNLRFNNIVIRDLNKVEMTKEEGYQSCMRNHHFFYSPAGKLYGCQEDTIL